jgi:hypothetical protein
MGFAESCLIYDQDQIGPKKTWPAHNKRFDCFLDVTYLNDSTSRSGSVVPRASIWTGIQ